MDRSESRARRLWRPAAVLGLVLLVTGVAAAVTWGGTTSSSQSDGHSKRALVKLRKTALGRVLVDRRGRTLYLFEADKGVKSVCYGACASSWPPLLTTGKPVAGAGVRRGLLGTTKRKNHKLQVTYHGHPLYFFVRDTKAGQTRGQGLDGFGGKWYVLDAAGKTVQHAMQASGGGAPPPPPTTTTSTGGYPY